MRHVGGPARRARLAKARERLTDGACLPEELGDGCRELGLGVRREQATQGVMREACSAVCEGERVGVNVKRWRQLLDGGATQMWAWRHLTSRSPKDIGEAYILPTPSDRRRTRRQHATNAPAHTAPRAYAVSGAPGKRKRVEECSSGEMGDELSEDIGDGCFQKGTLSKDMGDGFRGRSSVIAAG
jgi:hypothetical protein